jgi:hypothetical protein
MPLARTRTRSLGFDQTRSPLVGKMRLETHAESSIDDDDAGVSWSRGKRQQAPHGQEVWNASTQTDKQARHCFRYLTCSLLGSGGRT